MLKEVSKWDFEQEFKDIEHDFSSDGISAIYDYLENCQMYVAPEDINLLYCEYDSLEDFQADYSDEYEDIDDISEDTAVIPINDQSFIIEMF